MLIAQRKTTMQPTATAIATIQATVKTNESMGNVEFVLYTVDGTCDGCNLGEMIMDNSKGVHEDAKGSVMS